MRWYERAPRPPAHSGLVWPVLKPEHMRVPDWEDRSGKVLPARRRQVSLPQRVCRLACRRHNPLWPKAFAMECEARWARPPRRYRVATRLKPGVQRRFPWPSPPECRIPRIAFVLKEWARRWPFMSAAWPLAPREGADDQRQALEARKKEDRQDLIWESSGCFPRATGIGDSHGGGQHVGKEESCRRGTSARKASLQPLLRARWSASRLRESRHGAGFILRPHGHDRGWLGRLRSSAASYPHPRRRKRRAAAREPEAASSGM